MNNTQITAIIIIIVILGIYLFFTSPWRDAKADAAAAMAGGGYLLRKYMKNKKSHKNRK